MHYIIKLSLIAGTVFTATVANSTLSEKQSQQLINEESQPPHMNMTEQDAKANEENEFGQMKKPQPLDEPGQDEQDNY
jgi:hypothetical protein